MKKLFVPYELALKLKEKGFDEGCFKTYTKKGYFTPAIWEGTIKNSCQHLLYNSITAPLYQQATDWLRDVKFLMVEVGLEDDGLFDFIIGDTKTKKAVYRTYLDKKKNHQTYYGALNAAIEKALTLI